MWCGVVQEVSSELLLLEGFKAGHFSQGSRVDLIKWEGASTLKGSSRGRSAIFLCTSQGFKQTTVKVLPPTPLLEGSAQLLLSETFRDMFILGCPVVKGGEPRRSFTWVSGSHMKRDPVLSGPQIFWLMLVLLVLPLSKHMYCARN